MSPVRKVFGGRGGGVTFIPVVNHTVGEDQESKETRWTTSFENFSDIQGPQRVGIMGNK